ncbi:MAG: helix-turn-helix transcriptional regulator [Alphaproteobacteria bacterium]|nr:helix-turn-helix transcriptional regulator [Alphaproteobacteria bacterium]
MPRSIRTLPQRKLQDLLQRIRLDQGLTQQQVADRLGRPQSFVAKYEGGERRLDVVEFVQVAQALDTDPRRLFAELLDGK